MDTKFRLKQVSSLWFLVSGYRERGSKLYSSFDKITMSLIIYGINEIRVAGLYNSKLEFR